MLCNTETCIELGLDVEEDSSLTADERRIQKNDVQTHSLPKGENLETGEGGQTQGGLKVVWPPRYNL